MKLILAVDQNFSIGRRGKLLFSLKEDMRHFREQTTGHILVMGRKTLDSMPGGRPLPHRMNVVLTRDPAFAREGVRVAHDPEALCTLLRTLQPTMPPPVYLIGGGQVVWALFSLCDAASITLVDATVPDADTRIPDLRTLPDWRCIQESAPITEGALTYRFQEYRRNTD